MPLPTSSTRGRATLATGEFLGTATDCRARSSATARDRTGSQRRPSRRMRRAVWAALAWAALVWAALVWAALVWAVLVSVRPAVVRRRRHNEAKPICGRCFDPKMLMNAETIGP